MAKTNLISNQRTLEYALYVIASSYFNKTSCKTKLTESSMLIQYKEQKLDKQYQMEELCEEYMEELANKFPHRIFEQNMTVHLRRKASNLPTEILFRSEQFIIIFSCLYAGKKSEISYKIWEKKRPNLS